MEQTDPFIRQIEQLGKMLGRIMGLKEQGKKAEITEIINDELKNSDILLEDILSTPEEFLLLLIKNKKINSKLISFLGDSLYECGELEHNQENKFLISRKVLILFQYEESISKNVSFERVMKKERIKRLLSQKQNH